MRFDLAECSAEVSGGSAKNKRAANTTSKPTDLPLGAFDHSFSPNQMVKANHILRRENKFIPMSGTSATTRFRFNQLWKWY